MPLISTIVISATMKSRYGCDIDKRQNSPIPPQAHLVVLLRRYLGTDICKKSYKTTKTRNHIAKSMEICITSLQTISR